MGNITMMLSDQLQEQMKKHKEIRWSEVVRKAIKKKIEDLEPLDTLTAKSKLTQKDALEISKKVDISVAKKLGLVA